MHAVILSAGFGTRLYPLTKTTPKALLSINGRPVIEYIFDKLKSFNLKKTVIVTNERYYPEFLKWLSMYTPAHPLTLISDGTKTEHEKLGAVGDLKFAVEQNGIRDDVLLLVSDMIFSFSLNKFFAAIKRKRKQNWMLLYKLRDKTKASKYGVASLDKNDKVVRFEEKPREPFSSCVAFGVYYLPQCKLGLIDDFFKDTGEHSADKHDALGGYFKWLVDKKNLCGYVQRSGVWVDIGDKEQYERAEKLVRGRRMF